MAYLTRAEIAALFQTGDIITQPNMAAITNNHCLCSEYEALLATVNTNTSNIDSLKSQPVQPGPTGPAGPQGPAGQGVNIAGVVDSTSDLPATGNVGDIYFVGTELYSWSATNNAWEDVGQLQVDLTSVNNSIDTANTNISNLQTDITNLQTSISSNTSSISTNATDIAANTSAISSMQTQMSDFNATQSNFITDLQNIQATVTQNQSNISTLQTQVASNTSSLNTHLNNLTQYGFYKDWCPSQYGTEQFQTDSSGNPSRYFLVRIANNQQSLFYTASGTTVAVVLPNGSNRTIPSQIVVPTGTDGNNFWWTVAKNTIIKDICYDFQAWAANGPGTGGTFYPFASIWVNPVGSGNNTFTLQANSIAFATQSGNWTAGAIMTTAAPSTPITLNRGDRYFILFGAFVATGSPTMSPNPYIYANGSIYMEIAQS